MKPTKVSTVEEAVKKIKEAQVPLNLDLSLSNNIGDAAEFLAQSIKEARFPLTLYLSSNNIGEAGARFFAQSIKEALFPLTLYLSSNNIGDAGAEFLGQSIKEARVPLTLNLSNNNIGEAGTRFLAQGIKEALFPLTLDLYNNNIGDAGAGLLAQSIKEAQVPINLDLSLGNNIGEAGAEFLAQSIKEARFPLTLNLNSNKIGDAGAGFLAQGIKEARVPLNLDLGGNSIGDVGIMLLAQSIKEARVPLTLNLSSNKIGDAGARFLAQGIKEACVPLTLNLWDNSIGDVGVKFIAQSIKEARVPLILYLSSNNLGEAGAKFLAQSIKEARVPLTLDLWNCGVHAGWFLSNAERDNFIIDARRSPLEFFAKLKFNPFNLLGLRPILTQTPVVEELIGLNYPKDIAIIVQEYAHDADYLAWKIVSAIRAIEGASHDNKYSSINYELLAAVYSTAPAAEGSALEGAANDDGQDARVGLVRALNTKRILCGNAGDNNHALDYKERALELYPEGAERLTITDLNDKSRPDDSVAKIKLGLHRASIWFKALDIAIDSARLVQEPTMARGKKLALDYACLQGMVSGVNGYSVMIGVAETAYQLQLGEYSAAFSVAAGTVSAMALPVILAMANRPYLGIAYGAWIAASTSYGAITNAYSFATELGSSGATLRSAMAYKNLAEWLAASPAQALHDFGAKAKEYNLQINDLLFEKEKSIVQAQIKGEFGQKVFDYIYLPELLEKYILLNDVIRGELTGEEAQSLNSKPVAIGYGALEYDHCVRTEESREEAAEHYYCCNIARQMLDHVLLTVSGGLEILERL